jgi:glutamate N-acetyltransferase / amino-acid N-acetyltransferase
MSTVSPLAPARFPNMLAVPGVTLGGLATNYKYKNRPDLMLAVFSPGTTAAGVFTRSKMPSAPVDWCREALKRGRGKARAVVVNAGNSNAFTGTIGAKATRAMAEQAAALVGAKSNEVFVASTGVIGVPLEAERLTKHFPALVGGLESGGWRAAADAIMTTDTFPKGSCRVAKIDGEMVTINGIAKGSGMVAPDMATMLAFMFTNAKLPSGVLQEILTDATRKSFNCITVDSDTSTSDTLMAFATGEGAKHKRITSATDPRLKDFRAKFAEVALDLAQQVVRDGEGASKFITVTVTGATSAKAAHKIALSIANSPLVKTAIAGEDANWGRIVMAVGKAGEKADRDKLKIRIGPEVVTEGGVVRAGYDETKVTQHIKTREIDIAVDIGLGRGKATVWTCDLTHDYIRINADYRT